MQAPQRACLALGLLSTTALAQASFTEITAGPARAVSPDGAYVVGRSGTGAYLFTVGSGTTVIGNQDAVGVSSSGTLVLGNMQNGANQNTAGLATVPFGGGASWQDLPGLPGSAGCGADLSSAYALSDDGMVATGLAWEGCEGRAFKWTPAGGMTKLAQLGFDSARGNAVSGDGGTLGGWDEALTGQRRAAIWKPNGTEILPLANMPGNPLGAGEVWGFSTDGIFAAGKGAPDAFRFSEASGVLLLDKLPGFGGFDVSQANGVSDDGKLVVGMQGSLFTTPFRGWIWHEASGTQQVEDVLTQYGLSAPTPIFAAWDVTPDGRTIVGDATTALLANRGWRLSLPVWPWQRLGGGTSGAAGVPDLTGQGSVIPGSANGIRLESAAASSPAVIAVAGPSTPIPLFGGTLHAFPPVFVQSASTDANGELAVPFNWPPNAPSGSALTFQVGVIDGSSTFGIVLSNGLVATTP